MSDLPDRNTWRSNGKAEDCYKILQKGNNITTYVICGEGKTTAGSLLRRADLKCELAIHTKCVEAIVETIDTQSCSSSNNNNNNDNGGLVVADYYFGKFSCSSWGKDTMDFVVRDAEKTVTMKSVCATRLVSGERDLIQKRYIDGVLKRTTKFQQEEVGRLEVLWAVANCYST